MQATEQFGAATVDEDDLLQLTRAAAVGDVDPMHVVEHLAFEVRMLRLDLERANERRRVREQMLVLCAGWPEGIDVVTTPPTNSSIDSARRVAAIARTIRAGQA